VVVEEEEGEGEGGMEMQLVVGQEGVVEGGVEGVVVVVGERGWGEVVEVMAKVTEEEGGRPP
jgi:hypothetical protein